ncbi:exodeoxyribonuclease III [Actinomycetaceae bacterium TAE3-ERU4]|nr:exodeoxyribonuclease III [Actinomycetaceae bacterium TAE3-ERU4]
MQITTCNVNGIRAAFRKGMGEWLEESNSEIVLLQEVRANDEIIRQLVPEGWYVYNLSSELKGRAGVAILSREEAAEVREGMGHEEEIESHTGRWLEADYETEAGKLTVVSAYLHSGQAGTAKMDYKYQHLAWVTERLEQLSERKLALVAGDFNIVHTEKDIKNWKSNHNRTAGVLDEEIAYLDRWFGSGWHDVQRELTGEEAQGPYTWWSQRGQAFDNNAGWRIDYQMVTDQLAQAAADFEIGRANSYAERWSDHAPLTVRYKF